MIPNAITWRGLWTKGLREFKKRANFYKTQNILSVDYYRIGITLDYELPLQSVKLPRLSVAGIESYPCFTWLAWEFETRLAVLLNSVKYFNDSKIEEILSRDIQSLIHLFEDKKNYHRDGMLEKGLGSSHFLRILCRIFLSKRTEIDSKQIKKIIGCFVDVNKSSILKTYRHFGFKNRVESDKRLDSFHNIRMIEFFVWVWAMNLIQHVESEKINQFAEVVIKSYLDEKLQGFGEGICYDGYVFDFILDALSCMNKTYRESILSHPAWEKYLMDIWSLGAPGCSMNLAVLGDVEPYSMQYYLSAVIKLHSYCPTPWSGTVISCIDFQKISSQVLCDLLLLLSNKIELPLLTEDRHLFKSGYSVTLRSGSQRQDVSVVSSLPCCEMGHLHYDTGSLVIGYQGDWWVTDPGYQQYESGEERMFTIGATAHNTPLVSGAAQIKKKGMYLSERTDVGIGGYTIDFSQCYDDLLELSSAKRTVCLLEKKKVCVRDEIMSKKSLNLTYHWHIHEKCTWRFESGWCQLRLKNRILWISCRQSPLGFENLKKLPGSRGKLSIVKNIPSPNQLVEWFFCFAKKAPRWSGITHSYLI